MLGLLFLEVDHRLQARDRLVGRSRSESQQAERSGIVCVGSDPEVISQGSNLRCLPDALLLAAARRRDDHHVRHAKQRLARLSRLLRDPKPFGSLREGTRPPPAQKP